ncbi:hypothetical protein D5086_029024 [Populus alba]|uniref:Uncharacterized protein n=1 Tax=Populus alba TaxID=43335 RepID=A0ACC4AT05_POPAL
MEEEAPGASFALQFVPQVGDGECGTVGMDEGPGLTLPRAHSLSLRPPENNDARHIQGLIVLMREDNDDEADEVRNLVHEVAELTGKFNLSDFICFFKNLDFQGFGKRLKEVRRRFDTMTERIIKEHEEVRKIKKETGEAILTPRLHPTGPVILRESSESCTINGYEIPARTRLFVNRDPNYWENPLELQPERFLCAGENGRSQLDVRGQHFHFLPFGSGRRGCPGTTLALQMVQTGRAAMIQCFDWKVDGTVDMQEGTGRTLPRAHPLICVAVARLNPFPSF